MAARESVAGPVGRVPGGRLRGRAGGVLTGRIRGRAGGHVAESVLRHATANLLRIDPHAGVAVEFGPTRQARAPDLRAQVEDNAVHKQGGEEHVQEAADGQHRSFAGSDSFHPMLLPSVSLSYQVTAKSTIRANYKYSETSNTLTDLFQTPTYTSYHTKEANGGLTNYSGNHTSALMWSYKHPIKGNFIDVIVSWQRRNNIVLYRNSYHNQVLMREATDQRSSANSYFIRKSVAHAFSWAKAFLSFSSEYSLRKYRLLQGEKQIPNRVANARFELKFSMQPSDFFSCELKSRMDVCKWKSEKDGQNPDADKTTHSKNSLTLFFFPVKGMEIGCVNEWYYNVVKSISNHYFLDSYIAYRTKKYELRLDLYNLIGDGKYENQILSTITNVYALYKLRQREGLLTFGVNL